LRIDMLKLPHLFLFAATTILLTACSFSLAGDVTPPPGSDQQIELQPTQSVSLNAIYPILPPDLVNGASIYNQECAQCHGTQGLGDGPQSSQLPVPPDALGLAEIARQFTPAEWYTMVTQGNMEKYMPAFANLTDRQRWDVVAYAMSLSVPESSVALGKSLYTENCIICHGEAGKGDGPHAATLATPPEDFTNQSFMAQQSSSALFQAISIGITPDMPAYSSTLDEKSAWALVDYLRSFTFATRQVAANTNLSPALSTNAVLSSEASPTPQGNLTPQVTQSPEISSTVEITPTAPFYGTVTVQLINGSGGQAPSDAPVTLYGFDNMQNTYSETLSVGLSGVYTFTNVLMPAERVFIAGTDYASGTYGSDIAKVDPATPDLKLPITVYDSTTDLSALTADRVHIFFDFTDPQNVQVFEVFIISNPSNQAIVAPTKDGAVVTFPLPKGYSNLQFQDGELGGRYVQVDQGFADKMTVNPGPDGYQVIFTYTLPYNRKLDFSQPILLPTNAVVVLVPDSGVKLSSSQLQDAGTRDFQGTTYRTFNGGNLLPGSSIEFSLSGRPKQSTTSFLNTGTMQNLAIGVGIFGLALVMAGVWLFRRNQRKAALQVAANELDLSDSLSSLDSSPVDEDTLMDAIIALDDQFHAGNLPEEAYLERRAALKEQLQKFEHHD
jgi:mono/diheme cytochrome c family protein